MAAINPFVQVNAIDLGRIAIEEAKAPLLKLAADGSMKAKEILGRFDRLLEDYEACKRSLEIESDPIRRAYVISELEKNLTSRKDYILAEVAAYLGAALSATLEVALRVVVKVLLTVLKAAGGV
jgi:hypothetical protein